MKSQLMNYRTDHKLKIRNQKEADIVKAVEDATSILVDHLKLNNIVLRFERMNGWASSDAVHSGKWVESENMVKINIRNLYGASLKTFITVLGHELRHAVQSQHNVIDHSIKDIEYDKDSNLYYLRRYLNKPVEKDARKYQGVYCNIVLNDKIWTSKYNHLLDEIIGDEPVMIDDTTLTLEKMGYAKEESEYIKRFMDRDKKLYWFDIRTLGVEKLSKQKLRDLWTTHKETILSQPWVYEKRVPLIEELVS